MHGKKAQRAKDDAVPRLRAVPQPEPVSYDALEDAQANLAIIRHAMREAAPSSLAALSKRRDELIDRIRDLTKGGEISLADQLAAFRAARRSGA
ncbi:hypothetical protein [Gryllotalpicola protaetiae]|uniref:Uncharacterized protein n=1 Tax=Gryllotalpicola protaetiae TaxID=2419771 RepID=A0A387BI67_9MICO|nr:hypothetical protein [Gryllotalpicola protaetiae]AYG02378.1 hypothetical protein D7I44_01735 [Gryllotalpicola protaetiae]